MKMKPLFGAPKRFTSIDKANVVFVYDALNLFFSVVLSKHLGGFVTSSGRPSAHVFGTFTRIRGHVRRFSKPGQRVALCFAWDGEPEEKQQLLDTYKMNRDGHQQLDEEELNWRLDAYRDFLGCMPCTFLEDPKQEADDVISSLVANVNKPITIYSSDKDLWQLLAHRKVKIVSLRKSEPVTEVDLRLKYDIDSRSQAYKVALYKAVMGDASDNIPKVPRIPTKDFHKAMEPLSYVQAEEDCISLLMESAAQLEKPRAHKLLTEHEKLVRRNLELVTLKTDVDYTSIYNEGDKNKFEDVLACYECNSILHGGQYDFLFR